MNTRSNINPSLLGVIGEPGVVANSLSPRMMQAAFKALSLPAYYVPIGVESSEFDAALSSLSVLRFYGANITMPFKRRAALAADSSSERVKLTGSANTLRFSKSEGCVAEATDGLALTSALNARELDLRGAAVTIIGTGGVAYDAAVSLLEAGVSFFRIWNRTKSNAHTFARFLHELSPDIGLQVHDDLPIGETVQALIGCVPADAVDANTYANVDENTLVVDFAYRQSGALTPMMVAAQNRSLQWIDGHELLVRQGAEALRFWFGVEPPIEVMLGAVR